MGKQTTKPAILDLLKTHKVGSKAEKKRAEQLDWHETQMIEWIANELDEWEMNPFAPCRHWGDRDHNCDSHRHWYISEVNAVINTPEFLESMYTSYGYNSEKLPRNAKATSPYQIGDTIGDHYQKIVIVEGISPKDGSTALGIKRLESKIRSIVKNYLEHSVPDVKFMQHHWQGKPQPTRELQIRVYDGNRNSPNLVVYFGKY
tara:strand:+ start:2117 stop:2725 length:609 start_codon:yes stop_codon:yes gene_type:complete